MLVPVRVRSEKQKLLYVKQRKLVHKEKMKSK